MCVCVCKLLYFEKPVLSLWTGVKVLVAEDSNHMPHQFLHQAFAGALRHRTRVDVG